MTGPVAHSVVASALADPELLRAWWTGAAVAPPGLDVEALWKFAGLGVKVKHNVLRTDLPLVWQAISVFGVDVELFAEYAPLAHAHKAEGKTGRADKLTSLVEFLSDWLCRHAERLGPSYRVVADVLRHEAMLCELRRQPADDAPDLSPWPSDPSLDDVPAFCGAVRLLRLAYTPGDIRAVLARGKAAVEELARVPADLCRVYWKNPAARVRVLHVHESAFEVIRRVDGRRSLGAIAGNSGRGDDEAAAAVARETLAELGNLGAVALVSEGRREDRLC
jgi:hypothetical protein